MRTAKRILGVLVATTLATAGLLVTAPTASAAGCWASSCAGRDHGAVGCWATDVKTAYVIRDGVQLATVWNDYSSSCKANWSAAQLTQAARNAGYRLYVDIQTTDSNGAREFMCYPGPDNTGSLVEACTDWPYSGYSGSGAPWTDMIDGTNVTAARAYVFDSSGNLVMDAPVWQ
ncbi:hypothetical protein [Kitasatospora sp. NPDC059673]|uniref:hypothetical protein n=1 Tax=Kitasatospora sp. NPDC059673 TaxID=3346901 RepID=UPI00367500A1